MTKNVTEFRNNFLVNITNAERELVQLGLPGPQNIVIWYARARNSVADVKDSELIVEIDEQRVPPWRVNHYALPREVGTGRIEINDLAPATRYQVSLQLAPLGRRHTLVAHTAPALDEPAAFSFLCYSCFAPFEKQTIRQRTVRILALLRQRARARAYSERNLDAADPATGPSFVFATGDQVYVDGEAKPFPLPGGEQDLLSGSYSSKQLYPKGHAWEFFDILYRNYFALPPYDEVLTHLPTCMMWDDHDIRDGWGSHGDEEEPAWSEHYQTARNWFFGYQALRNPQPAGALNENLLPLDQAAAAALSEGKATSRPEFCYSFEWGNLATCFVMDLRSHRFVGRNAKEDAVISKVQEDAFEAWLTDKRWQGRPKLFVLVSSMPVTHTTGTNFKEWRLWFRADDRLDNWWSEKCQPTRDRLISLMVRHFRAEKQHRLLILSGDVHFSELLELSLKRDGQEVVFGHEIVSSGLAQAHFYTNMGERCHAQEKARIGDPKQEVLFAKGIERLLAPSFAELFVSPGAQGRPPDVKLRFYPVAEVEGEHLTNAPAQSPATPCLLPLQPLAPTADFMKQFIVSDAAEIPWDQAANSWEED